MPNQSEWDARQAERLRRVVKLESEAEFIHKELVVIWQSGERGTTLLTRDREIHAELEQARKEYEIGLKAKP